MGRAWENFVAHAPSWPPATPAVPDDIVNVIHDALDRFSDSPEFTSALFRALRVQASSVRGCSRWICTITFHVRAGLIAWVIFQNFLSVARILLE